MLPENLKEQETLTELLVMRTRKELFKGFILTLEKQNGITCECDAGIWSSLVQEVIVKATSGAVSGFPCRLLSRCKGQNIEGGE